jgi:hypothetical protein
VSVGGEETVIIGSRRTCTFVKVLGEAGLQNPETGKIRSVGPTSLQSFGYREIEW